MPRIRAPKDVWLADGELAEPAPRVLLADHDPVSRHVLGRVLDRSGRLAGVVCVDTRSPWQEWPLAQVDVAVLAVGPQEDLTRTVRELAARGIRILMIGVDWTRQRLDGAFAAGAAGCLVKDARIEGLAAAVHTVAHDHTVLSPELLGLYARAPRPSAGRAAAARAGGGPSPEHLLGALTDREREVLALLSDGLSTAETAGALRVSPATVKSHVSHALTKLGLRNRLEAVLLIQRVLHGHHPAARPQHRAHGAPRPLVARGAGA
ncbi:response regulator transcription factor [Kitasatospora sp. NBC_00374]|uniref:response regulator transcription factor n=1 Tax=Kitasatospora sp. NBC_00374 TaxID=2975964 RepID=UPI0030E4D2A6